MRYVIRTQAGEELTCPSLADLHALYAQGFLANEDLVRKETSCRWVALGSMPALQGVREEKAEPRKWLLLVAAALVLTLALSLLALSRYRSPNLDPAESPPQQAGP
jgi:hypothetical protein